MCALIARVAVRVVRVVVAVVVVVVQDDVTGDGTTTSVLFTGELLRQAERYLSEGLHPRVLTEGFELAKEHALELLDTFRSTR